MADMDNILDLFDCNDNNNDNDSDIPINENYFIAEILKLIKESNDFPLYIYVMIKSFIVKQLNWELTISDESLVSSRIEL